MGVTVFLSFLLQIMFYEKSNQKRRAIMCFRTILLLIVQFFLLSTGECFAKNNPNILFAVADDWSYGHAGAYGCKWVKTPTFDRIATHGVLFTRAYTPTAKCAPSRASILTGRNPWQLKAAANHNCYFPPEFKSYVEVLSEHGYRVGMTGKGWAPGVSRNHKGQWRQMTGKPWNIHKLTPPTTGISKNDYAANFEAFINALPNDKTPWCFWYGSNEPHRHYEYGSGVAKGGKRLKDIERIPAYWPDEESIRHDMLDYAFEVEHFDTHLNRMLVLLDKKGMLSNTVVVITGDHGMPFPHCKGQSYVHSNHVPLAIMWPAGIKKVGRTVTDFVSFIDLAPTFIELAGVAWSESGMAPVTGVSLLPILQSEKEGRVEIERDYVIVGRERNDVGRPNDAGYPMRGIISNGLISLHNFEPQRWPACDPETGYLDVDGSPTKTTILAKRNHPVEHHYWQRIFGKRVQEEFYDLIADPDCMNNLAASDPRHTKLHPQLFEKLKQQQDPRLLGQGAIFDTYPTAGERIRGFYEQWMQGKRPPAGWVNESDFDPPSISTVPLTF